MLQTVPSFKRAELHVPVLVARTLGLRVVDLLHVAVYIIKEHASKYYGVP